MYPGEKINLVHLRKSLTHIQSADKKNNCFNSSFNCGDDTSHRGSPTPSNIPYFVTENVASCFKIINSTTKVFPPHDYMIFIKYSFFRIRIDLIHSVKGSFKNRK